MTPFAREIKHFIDSHKLLPVGARVVTGLSGGADSVALLAVLSELGYECLAVHVNFGLRGAEADRDMNHARSVADALGAEFRAVRVDTHARMLLTGESVEMACRRLRYAEFDKAMADGGCDAIAVGHHREDNVETMVLNLLRGCGIHGVRAMLPRNGVIVRPLLETSKAQILDYVSERGLAYVIDSSNMVADVARNRLRLEVLPALTAAFPDAMERLSRSLANLRGCEQLYDSLLPPRGDSLRGVSPTLLREWLAPYGFNAAQCADMQSAAAGARFESKTHEVTVCPDGRYELTPLGATAPKPQLRGRIVAREANFKLRPGVLYLDASAARDADWQLRLWRDGDRMRPFGMKGSRMVADVLADAGISATARRRSWVLLRNGVILWAVGIRASAHFPVTKHTTEIIEITVDENH